MKYIDKLAENVVQLLNKKNFKIATAESCTGGLISSLITAVPGSSSVFDMGICTYANSAKISQIDVKINTLEKHGAVSNETAVEMADGIRKKASADIGISVTGIAGPTGEVEGKAVGTVFIAASTSNYIKCIHICVNTNGIKEYEKRNYIRECAAYQALILTKVILENNV